MNKSYYEYVLPIRQWKPFYKRHVRPSSIYYWNGSEKWDLSGNWFGSKWRLHWTLFQFDGLEYYEAKKCDSIVIKVGVLND